MDSLTTGTSTRNSGSLQQIGSCILGILVGLALFVLGLTLLSWNEGQAVRAFKSLDEGLNIVVSLENIDVVNQENNGKLVHLVGPLSTDQAVNYKHSYHYSGISVHAVKLKLIYEKYQWVEHEDKIMHGDKEVETTYSYSKEWRSEVINCSSFHETFNHKCVYPTEWYFNTEWITAFTVSVGQFGLSKGLIGRISEFHPLPPSYLNPPQDSQLVLLDGAFYWNGNFRDLLHPEIGDMRTRLEYAGISGKSPLGSPDMVTIVAKQLGSELVPYKTLAGDELEMLYYGQFSPKEIFDMEIFHKKKNQNTRLTWGIRFGGWLLVFLGLSLLARNGDWIPIANACIVMGEDLMDLSSIFCEHVAMRVNYMNLRTLILSITISSCFIGMNIGSYKPLLGISVFLIGLLPCIFFTIVNWESLKPKHD